MTFSSGFSGRFKPLRLSIRPLGKEGTQDDDDPGGGDPGEGDPGEGDPGEGDPGEEDPGEGDPGEGSPGEGGPSEDGPGEEGLVELSGAAQLLSTATSDGLSNPFDSGQGGWINGSPPMDPYTNTTLANGMSNPFVGENVDSFTNAAPDTLNMNAFVRGQDIDPFTGLQNASFQVSLADVPSQPSRTPYDGLTPEEYAQYQAAIAAGPSGRQIVEGRQSDQLPSLTPSDESPSLNVPQEGERQTSDDPSIIRLNVTPEEERNLRENREALAPIEREFEREANTGVHAKPVVNPNIDPDSLRVGWVFGTHEYSVAPQVKTIPDTGSNVLNYGLGALYSWRNLFAALDSLPLGIVADANKEFDRLGIPLEALPFDAVPLLTAEQTEYLAGRAARAAGNAARAARAVGNVSKSPLPEVVIHYDPIFAANPEHSNWYRFVVEALQEHQGGSLTRVLGRGETRLATDGTLRRLARTELKGLGFDLSDLQAGHPADSIINPYVQGGDVGTTYYFIEGRVNGEFGRQFSQQLNILGVEKGGQFRVTFTGPWPNFVEFPPIAPLASSPGLR